MKEQPQFISPDQLRIGIYVHLDLGWMDHPFTFNNFKIMNEAQIREIRALNLGKLRYDPLRSDCEPLPPEGSATAQAASAEVAAEVSAPAISPEKQLLQQKTERLNLLHESIRACEKEFLAAGNTVKDAVTNLSAKPRESREKADALVSRMVESVLTESDIVLHAISDSRSGQGGYLHALNVTVLALMLAKSLDMTAEEARELGIAAMFHDIGKSDIPDRILLKTDPLNKSEQALLEQHSELGARIALQSGLSERVAKLILQHHEFFDGSGYPGHLKNDQIDCLSRLLTIVNTYDNLCNPANPAAAMTPYEALAHMFSSLRGRFDSNILKLLIKSLGVYPPGSVVLLSNDVYGLVISVNPHKPLRPYVMLHMPDIPREAPMVIDLREEVALNISKCLRPGQLPKEVLDYLSPRKRVSYYFNQDTPGIQN